MVYLLLNPSVVSLTCFGSLCINRGVPEVSEWTEEPVAAFDNVGPPAATKFRDCGLDISILFLIETGILKEVDIPGI